MSEAEDFVARAAARVVNSLFYELVVSQAVAFKLEPGEAHAKMVHIRPSELDTQLKHRAAVIARLKIMAGINPAIKNEVQNGRIRLTLSGQIREFTVQVVPWGTEGESITINECSPLPDETG